ncbi:vWA domain-containing protein [Virgisporangium aurantiacum]|uniref:Tellurium resistance protein TerY n=1 Tax=Virgisporangium aurantiacum TaxID=175570 RepID=A0A8J3ZGM1_9ACTN|nr:VWA domain-containing protein [Virgisporangium aurantiacum]GIJ63539.1 tellurium resistance protein TerY [Virgisporangium aurantiacum]
MAEERAKLLPFYLVVDVSASMAGANIAAVNEIAPRMIDTLAQNPILTDKIRFALLDFSDEAQVRVPLCDLLTQPSLPRLETRAGTSFAAPLRLLRTEIATNVRQLKADNYSVHRPAVFFLTDGLPTDEWHDEFRNLTAYDPATRSGFPTYPNIIPFGVADADPHTLTELIHPKSGNKRMKMFMMDEGNDPSQAIRAMAEVMISSVLASGMSLAEGGSGLLLPADDLVPKGIHGYTADDDDFV